MSLHWLACHLFLVVNCSIWGCFSRSRFVTLLISLRFLGQGLWLCSLCWEWFVLTLIRLFHLFDMGCRQCGVIFMHVPIVLEFFYLMSWCLELRFWFSFCLVCNPDVKFSLWVLVDDCVGKDPFVRFPWALVLCSSAEFTLLHVTEGWSCPGILLVRWESEDLARVVKFWFLSRFSRYHVWGLPVWYTLFLGLFWVPAVLLLMICILLVLQLHWVYLGKW